MKCPYCMEEGSFDNSSINHIYTHNVCRRVFYVCKNCGLNITEDLSQASPKRMEHHVVSNLNEISSCPNCGIWLPKFPTSWIRSFTNIGKIDEVIMDLHKIETSSGISSEDLYTVQRAHNRVLYNLRRARTRGLELYENGAPKRRMNEYISFLLTSGVLKKAGKNITFTRFGNEFLSKENTVKFVSLYIMLFSNMKMVNGYQSKGKRSVYSYFKVRFIDNILDMLTYKAQRNKIVTSSDFGLAILARNKEDFIVNSLTNSLKSEGFKRDIYFGETNKELNRGVISTFINCLISLNVIVKNKNEYSITKIGEELQKFLSERPPIWENDISRSAELLVWRLLNNDLVSKSDLSSDLGEDFFRYAKEKHNIELTTVRDIHFNAFYDEDHQILTDTSENKLVELIQAKYLKSFEISEVVDLLETLSIIWLDEILKFVNFYRESLSITSQSLQSGRRWHERTKQLLIASGLNAIDYSDLPIYTPVEIPKLTLFLPGGTYYNPDILVKSNAEPKYVLVDAKDSNSLDSEVAKLFGYNLYASHSEVDTFCIISVRGSIHDTTLRRILDDEESFNRITLIDENALVRLSIKRRNWNELTQILRRVNGFNYISEKDIV